MGPGIIPSGEKEGLLTGNPLKGFGRATGAGRFGRVLGRPNQKKLIKAQQRSLGSPAFLNRLFFRFRGMDQDDIHFLFLQEMKRLTGTGLYPAQGGPRLFGKGLPQGFQQIPVRRGFRWLPKKYDSLIHRPPCR